MLAVKKELMGLWKGSVLVKQLALLLPAVPVPQLMGSASSNTFSTRKIMEVDLHPSLYMSLFIRTVTYYALQSLSSAKKVVWGVAGLNYQTDITYLC